MARTRLRASVLKNYASYRVYVRNCAPINFTWVAGLVTQNFVENDRLRCKESNGDRTSSQFIRCGEHETEQSWRPGATRGQIPSPSQAWIEPLISDRSCASRRRFRPFSHLWAPFSLVLAPVRAVPDRSRAVPDRSRACN